MKAEKIITSTEPIDDIKINIVTLLSVDEYEIARDYVPYIEDNWWLCSPGGDDSSAACVGGDDGSVDDSGYFVDFTLGVRPALEISNLESSNLQIGDKIIIANHVWTIISNNMALCDNIVGRTAFRNDWRADNANVYEFSDVKKWLDDWAVENKILEKEE